MKPEHLPLHHELDTDTEVMRHLLGRARTSQEVDEYWSPRCAQTTVDAAGSGWWVGRVGDRDVGWWCLSASNPGAGDDLHPGDAEIGWRVLRREWGQGLATEGAHALLQHAFAEIGFERVWAETMAVNIPSRRVMEKIGMRHVATEVREWDDPLPGAELGEVTYEITRREWV